jgi:hypothetical protein
VANDECGILSETMRVFGVDFTSAPRRRKPITCVEAFLTGNTLTAKHLYNFTDFVQFEAFLQMPGPWVAGFDFPFGQPRKLITDLGWPTTWSEYIGHVADIAQVEFEQIIKDYRAPRPAGDKHHKRYTDRLARSVSPMMLVGVPVGKMFFQGAPRLLSSGISVLPCHPTADNRIALEAYPALVARKFIQSRGYKNDQKQKQTPEQAMARRDLVEGLLSSRLPGFYGVSLELEATMLDTLILHPSADQLDALLCAIQASWAISQPRFGIPEDCDLAEGWIVDPVLSSKIQNIP